jgi:hypothetical protein
MCKVSPKSGRECCTHTHLADYNARLDGYTGHGVRELERTGIPRCIARTAMRTVRSMDERRTHVYV